MIFIRDDIDQKLFSLSKDITKKKFNISFFPICTNNGFIFKDKLIRDYTEEKIGSAKEAFAPLNNLTGTYPAHILKAISLLNKSDYYCVLTILFGGLPYGIIFEIYGWDIKYVVCKHRDKNYKNKDPKLFYYEVDNLQSLKGKRILLVDNNIYSGNTVLLVLDKLINRYSVKTVDLFVDYIVPKSLGQLSPIINDPSLLNEFNKKIISINTKITKEEALFFKRKYLGMLLKYDHY